MRRWGLLNKIRGVGKCLAEWRNCLARLARQKQLQRCHNLSPDLGQGIEYERDDGEGQVGPIGVLTIPLFDHGQTCETYGHP